MKYKSIIECKECHTVALYDDEEIRWCNRPVQMTISGIPFQFDCPVCKCQRERFIINDGAYLRVPAWTANLVVTQYLQHI